MSSIPLKVYITPFAEKGAVEAQKWTTDAAKAALNVVNATWAKADVAFVINDFVMDRPLDMAKSARSRDRDLLDVLSLRHQPENLVHIYLVNPIENLKAGGCSYVDSNPEPASFVQWYGNVDSNGRAWAHELGHLMSLDHVQIDYQNEKQAAALVNNLMTEGLGMGKDLTDKQLGSAKSSKLVKRFSG
ncbi:MAG: hypothetical protein JOY90_06145 [Bradyrhizobium sp.]|uniref:hypothetical protein n=1 Tax=Bradyrhizobium sp. TaxID=376 RepID=UPI001D25D61B|nr:hypothetical protein [Bradyrhizobium sp.]MBV9560030.1 hypothetical protein [Bradyrhizobium sp.]